MVKGRCLQIATATPYLPPFARLNALFPGLRITAHGFLVPVGNRSPEEVLAACVEEGVRVAESRIVYAETSPRLEAR